MPLDFIVARINGEHNDNRDVLAKTPWISKKSLEFPLNVECLLRRKAEVDRIEIIAHNKFIPKRIEIFTREGPKDDFVNLIGEVEFRKNKSSPDKFELKSVFLEERCAKVLFRIWEPHIDVVENPDALVGLESVTFFGRYLPDANEDFFDDKPHKETAHKKYSEEMDAFLDAVEKNKERFVANEDFKSAKQAQVAYGEMRKAKKEIEELERDKMEAIDDEDFQRAEDLHEEIKALRSNVLASVDPLLLQKSLSHAADAHRPKNLFNTDTKGFPPPRPKLFTPVDLSPTQAPMDPAHTFLLPPRAPTVSSRQSRSSRSTRSSRRPHTQDSFHSVVKKATRPRRPSAWDIALDRPPSSDSLASLASTISTSTLGSHSVDRPRKPTSSASRRSTSTRRTTNKFLEKENMIVPAALKRRNGLENPPTPSKAELNEDLSEDQLLSSVLPNDRPNVRASVSIFGMSTMRKIYSKSWESRKDGIAEVRDRLELMSPSESADSFETLNFLLSHLLRDPLLSVYKDALALLRYVCENWMIRENLSKNFGRLAAENHEIIAQRVLQHSNDKRAINETMDTFQHICGKENVAKAYAQRLLSTGSMKTEKGRAFLIERLARQYGVPNNQVALQDKPVAKFAASCMRNSDQQVRTIGKNLMLKLYEANYRDVVQAEMKTFSDVDSNNPTYRRLVDEIHTVDVSNGRVKKKISFKL